MSTEPSRRAFLGSAVGVASSLAGCAGGDPAAELGGVTPAPIPSDVPTSSPTRRPTPGPAADAIDFRVEGLADFDEAGPARLAISLRNAGDRTLTALGGSPYVVPFVDDDHAGEHVSGQAKLLCLPDGSGLRVDPAVGPPDRIEAYLPGSPTEGCWLVPFDWPGTWVRGTEKVQAVTLEPREVRRHSYTLYFVRDCLPGTYRFEQTVDVAMGDPPLARDLHRVALRFKLLVTPAMNVHVDAQPPVVRRRSERR